MVAKTVEADSIENFIGKKIWLLRKSRGFSQEVLAKKSSINTSFLGCIERGQKCPTLRILDKIRMALDVTYSEFFDFSPYKSPGDKSRLQERCSRLIRESSKENLLLLDGILEVFLEQMSGYEKPKE